MKKIKTTLLIFTIFSLSIPSFSQVLTFTNQQDFLNAIGDTPYNLETFDDNSYDGFTVAPNTWLFDDFCGTGGILSLDEDGTRIFTFSAPKNAFGINIFDAANLGFEVEITLMTDAGEEYTVLMDQEGDLPECNQLFFGVINFDMDFTMATITRMSGGFDATDIDNVYCAAFERAIPTLSQWGVIALLMIMLILGLVVVRQRKVIFG